MIRLCAALPPARSADEPLALAVRLGLWGTSADLPLDMDEAAAAALGRRYRDAGLRIVQVPCPRNLSTPVSAVRAQAVRDLRQALRLGSAAGALHVVSGAGHRDPERAGETSADHPDNARDDALDTLAQSCRDIVAAHAVPPARLLIATSVGGPVDTLWRAAEVVRRVADPRCAILFDPVGLMQIETYFDNGSFVARCVQQLAGAIGMVRARDALMRPDPFRFALGEVPLGDGALDYPALLRALAALPGELPLLVTGAASEGALRAALDHLRAIAARVGVAVGGAAD